ncbi:MAG: hypothetical protein KGI37_11345 [Alphaproteobacteria bacterium]|nr:hypothetical protein [Alphaproteobacteria bacterium]
MTPSSKRKTIVALCEAMRQQAGNHAAPQPADFRHVILSDVGARIKNERSLTSEQMNALSDVIMWLPQVLRGRRFVNTAIFQVSWIAKDFHRKFGRENPNVQSRLIYLGVLSSPGGADFTQGFIEAFNDTQGRLTVWANNCVARRGARTPGPAVRFPSP